MLLGMPFWALANCHKDVYADGYMTVTLSNPNPPFQHIVVPTTAREFQEMPRKLNSKVQQCESLFNEDKGVPKTFAELPMFTEETLESFLRPT